MLDIAGHDIQMLDVGVQEEQIEMDIGGHDPYLQRDATKDEDLDIDSFLVRLAMT